MAYDSVTRSKIDSGTTFAYTATSKRTGRYEAHDDLKVLVDGKPVTRESRDSEEHPESTPIIVGFDVTGSMGDNPAILQRSLKGLFGMLVRKDVVSDPQVAIAAYGDTHCDRVPLQLSQFESDNRIDDNLDNVFVEMGGGGNMGETSTALVWFIASHVVTDAWEKRGKRGYLFLVGDECPLSVTSDQAHEFMGESIEGEITPDGAFNIVRERWDTYFLLIDNYTAKIQHSRQKYEAILGEDHVITLQSADAAPAIMASVIGLAEETVDDLVTDLVEAGFDSGVALQASEATNGKFGKLSKVDDGYADLGL